MVRIDNYNNTYLKVNKDNTDIFFLLKSDLSVSIVSGNIVLTTSTTSHTYKFTDVTIPALTTPDELAVQIRIYIDNG